MESKRERHTRKKKEALSDPKKRELENKRKKKVK